MSEPATPKVYTARAQIVLARDDTWPLREVPLKPDPLTPFAFAFAELRDDLGDQAEVVMDLLPVTRGEVGRRRRKAVSGLGRGGRSVGRLAQTGGALSGGQRGTGADAVFDAFGVPPPGGARRGARASGPSANPRAEGVARLDELDRERTLAKSLRITDPHFQFQLTIRTRSHIRGRPQRLLQSFIACFEEFGGENYLRVRGRRVFGRYLGSDAPWSRAWFDRRVDHGIFRPGKRQLVSATQIGGLIKPATVHCPASNVIRTGGVVPPPPRNLPTFNGSRTQMPWGTVTYDDAERTVAVNLDETFFTWTGGRSRYGKALALDTPLPTPEGWTSMGDVGVGDVLFDEAGNQCTVIDRTEVMVDRPCYEVVFSDGSTIVADGEHRWVTSSYAARKSASEARRRQRRGTADHPEFGRDQSHLRARPSVVDTDEIRATLKTADGKHANHAIAVAEPIECKRARLLVDPYVLGVWLGDGASDHGGITCADVEIVEEIRAAGYEVVKWGDQGGSRPYQWGIKGVRTDLKQLGVHRNKHIPPIYLRASVEQRLALLQGLMDTDGHCAKAAGNCEFTGTNERLVADVYELLASLGIKATITESDATLNRRVVGRRWRIFFTPPIAVFRLPRKLERQRLDHQSPNRTFRYVVDVRPVEAVPVRCISVDSPTNQYLAGATMIPTHNTETSLCRFVHVARAGHGALFLDPHADALARVKPYLVTEADRVIELSIARGSGSGRQVGWNPFSMEGLSREDIEDKMAAIVDSFAAAMGWVSDRAPRALTLTQAATRSLLELAYQLPDELAPTIFQMTTLLSDEDWRNSVLPRLTPALQAFWVNRFPRLGDEAITPVTNVIDRMQGSPSIAALLGSSRSTYNLREAMDNGAIVLVRLRGTGQIDQLMASFVVYDLLRAVLSRWDTPPTERRPLHAFMDEVQSYDHSVKGLLASALEEGGKFGLRLHLMNQQPTRLANQTRDAVMTNRSHLMATNLGYESARLLAKEWQGLVTPETIQELDKFQFITQVTHRGQTTTPFRARGLSLEQMYGDPPEGDVLGELEAAIDRNSGRRSIEDTLEELATLDKRISDYLTTNQADRRPDGDRERRGRTLFRSDRVRQYGHGGGMGPGDHEEN